MVAVTRTARTDISLNTPIPAQLLAQRPTALFVHGTARVDGHPAGPVELIVDGYPHEAKGYRGAFWGPLGLDAAGGARVAEIAARVRGAAAVELGAVELLAEAPERPTAFAGAGAGTVCIAMATHEPDRELLAGQLDSIRAQTHGDWVCVISDDASGEERFGALEAAVAGDPRFFVSRSKQRLGAYENFHRVLRLVPLAAGHVALADQDDRWHSDKLAALLDGLGDANLVFADMRITDPAGAVLSPTYWTRREPNHANFASLLLGNSVTGAASLFPRRLLDEVLPFPPRFGNLYHDHWLALVARALGRIAYVPRALHDYVQHPDAVIGHAGANRGVEGGGVTRRLLALRGRPPGRLRTEWRRIYFTELCRMRLQAFVLDRRLGDRMGAAERRAVRLALRGDGSPALAGWLATRQLRRLWRDETIGSEAAMLRALAWRAAVRRPGRRSAGDPYHSADLPAGVADPVEGAARAQDPSRPVAGASPD